jgi:hypothetical protein
MPDIDLTSRGASVRQTVLRNVVNSDGPWILIKLDDDNPTILTAGKFTRKRWLKAYAQLRDRVFREVKTDLNLETA